MNTVRTRSDRLPLGHRARALLLVPFLFGAGIVLAVPGAAAAPPFGQIDTPAQNAAGVQGAIGVTGWALDDVGVTNVKIYRNCMSFENQVNCQVIDGNPVVYIGTAAFLSGARPDVEAAFPGYPQGYRAGWGYLMLTNMLPHVTKGQAYGGQGPITLYAFATDQEGNRTLLGRSRLDHTPTTIALANDTIAKPFGAIDTPGQGQSVAGGLANFGWVLTPDLNTTKGDGDIEVPTDGSTMNVVIDGVAVGKVNYNQCRGTVGNPVPAGAYCNDDVANIFGNPTPQPTFSTRTANVTKHRNLDTGRAAIGSYDIDTTTLSSGLHTIAWGVIDSAGRAEGIGSRFFLVTNGRGIALTGNLAFGNVPVGTSATSTLSVTNPGAEALTVTGLSLPSGFTSSWSAGTIAAGSSQPVTITFSPTIVQVYSGTVTVTANHSFGTNTIAISGTGASTSGAAIALGGSLSFGNLSAGATATRTLTIGNAGTQPLVVTAISLPAGFTGNWSAGTIGVGGSQPVTITFAPTLVLSYSGTIAVTANNAYGTNTIGVSGNGTPPAGFPQTFPAGGYVVGTDIYPGRYYADPTYDPLVPTSGCFWERRSNADWSKHAWPDVITNEFVGHDAAQVVVDVLPTDVAFASDSDCGTWSSTPLYGPQTTIRRGTWVVGSQIQAGTYRATASVGCYWARLRSFSGTPDADAVIDSATIGSAGVVEVTISAGDVGFRNGIAPNATSDCGEWTLVGSAGDAPPSADGALLALADGRSGPPVSHGDAIVVAAMPSARRVVSGRIGFDFDAPVREIVPDAAGGRYLQIEELGRLELTLGPVDAGYLVANGKLRDLPPGSHLDLGTGVFSWLPGPGYIGRYQLVFVCEGARITVAVTIRAKADAPVAGSEIRMHLDVPRTGETVAGELLVAGWAFDPRAWTGSGIGVVDVWARRRDAPSAAPVYLGSAALGGERPDLARAFGPQFAGAGFGLRTSALGPGRYEITTYAWNRRTARWEDARSVTVTVR